jgi:predicted nucleic-acid-binding protein
VIGLDTNVLVRYYVTSTDETTQQQSALARDLIESGRRLYVSKSVVLELEWVLRGYYKNPTADVLTVLHHLQVLPNVELEDSAGVALAIEALADGFDFADALHNASYRQCSQVVTFDDRRFARRAAARAWKPSVHVLS